MRKIKELIDPYNYGWTLLKQWIEQSTRQVNVLPIHSKEQTETALVETQVTTKSILGAIIYHTGGVIVNNGWIRIWGSGSETLNRSIPEWSKGKSFQTLNEVPGYLVIADDVLGGLFCINGGTLGNDIGNIYYFAPDCLDFEPLEVTYSELINFFLLGDIDTFYQDFHWSTETDDLKKLSYDEVFNFMPPLWTKEGKQIENTFKGKINIEEYFNLNVELRLGLNRIEDKYL
ncbi:DUF2625 family protein [Myroides pelagicus]|uniref:DUF2625 family protein n=1 Tax=Myroides pelagicus TaxID=270914 RepID=A0A7K1GND1_9FLAO|nr:DUF2625 family protein [Myroides pelagicus]MEC4112702.1 DUF2625 family protein [Myroides pelagicus]MTH29704.1 DUF2625 family protein [Myroides pelagicus]